ncbi:vanadium-dependent haloperoxidase [Fodinicola acaciae]|uniref:vanadium-dependent haloperoxidase n=1 Tax=Fodinicola acaciae TaxID=2681555 RepID=UPI0013D67461|nr:vanadium-dependent haloperoxidase [Fodinicola acaciae]
MRKVLAVISVIMAMIATTTTSAPAATADTRQASGKLVVDWNAALLKIVRTAGAQPATKHPTRSFAIMQVAIYDAVLSATHAVRGANASEAAAAQAAHDSLAALYPAQRTALDRQLADELGAIPDGSAKSSGIHIGASSARAVLAARAYDGSDATPPPFVAGHQPGDYQLTPPAFPKPVFTHWANVRPFVLTGANQFRPRPYPALSSRQYARAINEVSSLGRDSSTTRTADQTTQAKFWAAPIWNYWNEIAQAAALRHHLGLSATARLFAVLDVTFADATIAFYGAKYHFERWRPVTAIRAADTDGNPATTAIPDWNPLATTPPDPSYPGAHSVIGEAGASVLGAFFGPVDRFIVSSEVLPGVSRSFVRYQDAADEAGLSRIYAGIHTRLDHVAGQQLGRQVAAYVLTRAAIRQRISELDV